MPVATLRALDEFPAVLTIADVQAILGVSHVTARRIANGKGFPLLRNQRTLRIPKRQFIRWLETQTGSAQDDE